MTHNIFDRKGKPIDTEEWGRLSADLEYKVVARSTLQGGLAVSTVWLGLDHAHGHGPPVIFETMVFPSWNNMSELDCHRYHTEDEAFAGHWTVVDDWSYD